MSYKYDLLTKRIIAIVQIGGSYLGRIVLSALASNHNNNPFILLVQ